MLYYDKVDVSDGSDLNKTSASKKRGFCRCCYFLDKGFKFQPYVCNSWNDVLMMSVNPSDIVTLNIKGVNYCCIADKISKKMLQIYYKMLTWPRGQEYYMKVKNKIKNYITT